MLPGSRRGSTAEQLLREALRCGCVEIESCRTLFGTRDEIGTKSGQPKRRRAPVAALALTAPENTCIVISGYDEMITSSLVRVVQMHKAIGHPVRLRLLAMLRRGPLCVCQLTVVVKLAGSTVSEHLAELRKAGVVTDAKEGRWVEYRLAENPIARQVLDATWPALDGDADIAADAVVVAELRKIPLDELCSAELDLGRIAKPKLAAAIRKAAALRREARP